MHLYGNLSEPVAVGILVLFALYLGLYHALFGVMLSFCRRAFGTQGALITSPLLWVGVELARTHITGFPWDLLGITQVDHPLLTRLAPWTGVYGLSFVIATVNALWLARLKLRERRWTRPALSAAGVVVVMTVVLLALRPPSSEPAAGTPAHATLLQENLEVGAQAAAAPPETEAEMLTKFTALSERPAPGLLDGIPELPRTRAVRREVRLQLGDAGATSTETAMSGGTPTPTVFEQTDVVLWPESPAPFAEEQPEFRSAVGALARTMDAPVIVGNLGTDRAGQRGTPETTAIYNSASFVRPDGEFAGRYDKMHLVPFGEYTPFKRLFFFAGHLLDEVGTFQPGKERRVFGPFGVFICYESIFGDEVRQFTKLGASVLVNLSNDAWYGDSGAPWQHLNMVRMRAIENHRWILRATNTGVTAAIDPHGRVVAAAPRHLRTAIRVPFFFEHDQTFYVRHGDWFAQTCAAAAGVLVVMAVLWGLRPTR